MLKAVFSFERQRMLGGLLPLVEHAVTIVRMRAARPALAERLLLSKPGDIAPTLVDVDVVPFGIGLADADGRELRQGPEPLLAGP